MLSTTNRAENSQNQKVRQKTLAIAYNKILVLTANAIGTIILSAVAILHGNVQRAAVLQLGPNSVGNCFHYPSHRGLTFCRRQKLTQSCLGNWWFVLNL